MNRIEKVLKKLNVPYKKYGEREDDALEVSLKDDTIVILSAFDDELQICTIVEVKRVVCLPAICWPTLFKGWMTYDSIIAGILNKSCVVK